MLRRVSSDSSTFRPVEFDKGFNVIVAERAEEATSKDTRNGVGKTALLEIIHYCLGATLGNLKVLNRNEIRGWTFKLDFDIEGKEYSCSRSTTNTSRITASGDFSDWDMPEDYKISNNEIEVRATDWTKMLGSKVFQIREKPEIKFNPTFRSLISYFLRRPEAFRDPFSHHEKQLEWDKQVNVSCLLGLNWEYASRFQLLRDDEKRFRELKHAVETGQLSGYFGSLGELEAERVNLAKSVQQLEDQLKDFKVHSQYEEIENIVNALTKEIKELVNSRVLRERMIEVYKQTLIAEQDVTSSELKDVYEEAGLSFPKPLLRDLEVVEQFHRKVIANRRNYLTNEIEKLENEIIAISDKIRKRAEVRSENFSILKEQHALDEYILLSTRLSSLRQKLEEVRSRIETFANIESNQSRIKISRQELIRDTKNDLTERAETVDLAREFFMENSRALYDIPGRFTLDVYDGGYRLKVNIERAGSEGIERMKTFCFDLMLIQLRSNRRLGPNFLMHDSGIFDGVDQRQVAKALELASKESQTKGFQYICSINSDAIPMNEFSDDFIKHFQDSVRIKLIDSPPDKSLLGIRF